MKTLLILGCGDIASRALPQLSAEYRVSALVRSAHRTALQAAAGIEFIQGDLDRPETLGGLTGPYDCILHSAPPPDRGDRDTRTRNALDALTTDQNGRGIVPRRFVYISTSGVYGDCGGESVEEARAVHPMTPRALRRVDAERAVSEWCAAHGTSLALLRVPGIYAADRLPLERLKAGAPAIAAEQDIYTNHIHADDLAALVVLALRNENAVGAFNANDDTEMKAGDWLDLVADRSGLPRPPRVSRAEAQRRLSPVQWSFLNESRRLVNRRMKETFGIQLLYPTVHEGVPPYAGCQGDGMSSSAAPSLE